MTQKEINIYLWKRDWCLQGNAVATLALIGMLIPHVFGLPLTWYYRECGVIFIVLILSVNDSLGFHLTQDRDEDVSVLRTIYRIIQFNPQWLIAYPLIGIAFGWWISLGCALCWWFGGYDFLYYILRKEPAYGGELTWVSWSIPGLLGIKVYWKQFVTSAIIGYLIAIGSAFL